MTKNERKILMDLGKKYQKLRIEIGALFLTRGITEDFLGSNLDEINIKLEEVAGLEFAREAAEELLRDNLKEIWEKQEEKRMKACEMAEITSCWSSEIYSCDEE